MNPNQRLLTTISFIRPILLFILVVFGAVTVNGQARQLKADQFRTQEHPRIFAREADRSTLVEKVKSAEWAGKMLEGIKNEIEPLVLRHQQDPEFIVSRLQLNWEDGHHYTDFYTQGNFIPKRSGNAPYPTIRVAYARSAAGSIPPPPYDHIVPYGNGDLVRQKADRWESVPFEQTGLGAQAVNQKILEQAYKASIVYYFTKDQRYAKFAADIIWPVILGASYQNEINPGQKGGPNGFLSWETLGDTRSFATIPLTYDFIYNYLMNHYFSSSEFLNGRKGERWAPGYPKGKTWAIERIHAMFERLIDNKLSRGGGLVGNWNTNEHESGLLYAFALDDDENYPDGKGREYYVTKFLYGPTTETHGAYADLTPANIDPKSGLWHEPPGGYGQLAISQMVRLGYWYFKNGIDVLANDTLLRKAALSYPEVAFPNGRITNWGDASYGTLSAEQAELMLSYAVAKHDQAMQDTYSALLKFNGSRSFNGIYLSSLFFYQPDLPASIKQFHYPRVSYGSDFSIIFERNNAADAKDAFQYNVYGFGRKSAHRHANGMSVEFYGRGEVLGFDYGAGADYWVEQHVKYNAATASHNTVMPNGFTAEMNKPQDLQILHAEPTISGGIDPKNQLSVDCQFTDTYNRYATTKGDADQRRTLALIRMNEHSGFFIDVFRSRMVGSADRYHDYIYHNIGKNLTLKNDFNVPLPFNNLLLDSASGDGYKFYQTLNSSNSSSDINADFDTGFKNIHMNVWMAGNVNRTVYALSAPPAPRYYVPSLQAARVPTLLVRQRGEAWTQPFVAVYEPYGNGSLKSIQSVNMLHEAIATDLVGIRVKGDVDQFTVLNAIDSSKVHKLEDITFRGTFAIIKVTNQTLHEMYLGSGFEIKTKGIGFSISGDLAGEAALTLMKKRPKSSTYLYSAGQSTKLSLSDAARNSSTFVVAKLTKAKAVKTIIGKREMLAGVPVIRFDLPAGYGWIMTILSRYKP